MYRKGYYGVSRGVSYDFSIPREQGPRGSNYNKSVLRLAAYNTRHPSEDDKMTFFVSVQSIFHAILEVRT